MPDTSKLLIITCLLLAMSGLFTYCVEQDETRRQALKLACIEAKGDWAWGGCTFPKSEQK